MTLIKHSVRTVRQPCSKCGSKELYWAHDTDGRPGKHYCSEHSSANFTLINREGTKHDCQGTGNGDHDQPDASEATPEAIPAAAPPATPTAPVTAPTAPVAADDRMGALAALLDLLAPKVDANQVHSIVDERLRGLVLPLRVEYQGPDGNVKAITGVSHKAYPIVLSMILAGRKAGMPVHVYMHGPGGTGKTSIAPQVAEALGLPYHPISLGPTMTESKLMGYCTATGEYNGTAWTHAIEHGGLVLLDECDSANSGVLTVADAALANGHVGLPDGRTIEVHRDFVVIAAGNTVGNGPDRMYNGRQTQDKAFMDRFTFVHVDYDLALEESMCTATGLDSSSVSKVLAYVRAVRANVLAQNMPVLVGMRATIGSCILLAGNVPWRDVLAGRIRHGMSDSDWRKVSDGVSQPAL